MAAPRHSNVWRMFFCYEWASEEWASLGRLASGSKKKTNRIIKEESWVLVLAFKIEFDGGLFTQRHAYVYVTSNQDFEWGLSFKLAII